MDLADGGSRGGLVLEVLEQLLARLGPLLVEHALHLLPWHRGCLGAQGGELLLIELAVLGRQELRVDERRELPDLHGGALHAAERLDHALRGLEMAPFERARRLLLRAGEVGGAGPRVARPLSADHRAHLGGPPDAAGGDRAVVLRRHRLPRIRTKLATLARRMAEGSRPTIRAQE